MEPFFSRPFWTHRLPDGTLWDGIEMTPYYTFSFEHFWLTDGVEEADALNQLPAEAFHGAFMDTERSDHVNWMIEEDPRAKHAFICKSEALTV